ncbi:MAG: hypothetical protein ABGX16_21415 [Pirellulales bacterium]
MKRITSVMAATMLLLSSARADVIKPNDVRATSHFGVGLNIQNLVNGDQGPDLASPLPHFGLMATGGPGVLDDTHGVIVGGSVDQWGFLSGCSDAGIPGGSPAEAEGADCGVVDFGAPTENGFATLPVDDQIIEFEFDGAYDLTTAHIWNDNEDGLGDFRGVDEFEIQVNTERTGGTFVAVGTTYNLTADFGFDPNSAQVVPLVASGVRRVRFLLNSAFSGIGGDDEYVGLSEVRFEGTLITPDLAADADKNGMINGNDFLTWQGNFGHGELDNEDINGSESFNSTLTATQSSGDYDNNNVVNADDLTVWGSEFGTTSPASVIASISVPEPSSLLLAATVVFGGLATTRRYFRRRMQTHITRPNTDI